MIITSTSANLRGREVPAALVAAAAQGVVKEQNVAGTLVVILGLQDHGEAEVNPERRNQPGDQDHEIIKGDLVQDLDRDHGLEEDLLQNH